MNKCRWQPIQIHTMVGVIITITISMFLACGVEKVFALMLMIERGIREKEGQHGDVFRNAWHGVAQSQAQVWVATNRICGQRVVEIGDATLVDSCRVDVQLSHPILVVYGLS